MSDHVRTSPARSLGLCNGRLPFWLKQKALVSVHRHTLRPGGLTLTRRAVEFCDFSPKDRILDVGCGYGMTLKYLQDHHGIKGTGIDPAPCADRSGESGQEFQKDLVQGALPCLPFADNTWQGIFLECVLSLARIPADWLGECRRLLAVNGKLVITDLYIRKWHPHHRKVSPSGPDSCNAGARSLMEMMTDIEAAGLQIEIIEDHTPLLRQLGTPDLTSKTGYCMIVAGKYRP